MKKATKRGAKSYKSKSRYTPKTTKRPYYRGRGGYWYVGGEGTLSANLGKFGSATLGASGGYANKQVARNVVSGKGDYQIRRNVLYEGSQMPEVRNKHAYDNATIIRHSEYICDIISSSTVGAFKVDDFAINPGLAQSFEYLAQLAANYTEYKIEGMIFEFRTRSVDALNSTNTALGSVYMATQYNSLEPNFSSKAEMSSYMYCNNCKPSESMLHIIECDPRQTSVEQLYIRTGSVPTNSDPRLYDLGRLQIATQGMQAASVNIGELHVTYQVALYKSRLYQSLGYLNDFQSISGTSVATSGTYPVGTGLASVPLGSAWSLQSSSNMPLSTQDTISMVTTGGVSNRIYFRSPRYPMGVRLMFSIMWKWPTAKTQDLTAPTFSVASGAVDKTADYFNSASLYSSPPGGVSSQVWTLKAVFDFPYGVDPYGMVTYNGTFPSDTADNILIVVSQVPNVS